jgi:large subunit ribosomal protein L25
MKQLALSALDRPERKTSAARRLRKEGKIPAIIYGHNDPIAVSLDAREFGNAFKVISESQIIQLHVGDKTYDVLIKDYQEDILTGRIEHLDFFEIEAGVSLRTHISIHLEGNPVGTKEGGVLNQPLHEVEIECLPKDIPDAYQVDVSGLDIGDSVHVSDLPEIEGVTVLSNEETVIALVTMPRMEEPETDEEEGLEGEEGAVAEEGQGESDEDEESSGEE